MSRKYEEYLVRITNLNGDYEDISFTGINTCSYSDMLNVYRDVKEKHENDNTIKTISFLGKSSEGELNAFFTKKVTINRNTHSELMKDCREVVREINGNIELLSKQHTYHKDMLTKYNKQRDTLLHMVENSSNNEFNSEEEYNNFKIEMFNELENVSNARRYSKEQIADLGVIKDILKGINVSGFIKDRRKFYKNSHEYKTDVEKEVIYADEKQKKEYLSKYSNKFDKHIDDPGTNVLYFYNNVGDNSSKNQSKDKLNKKLDKNRNRVV